MGVGIGWGAGLARAACVAPAFSHTQATPTPQSHPCAHPSLPFFCSFNQTETLSTVRFGSRAKNIKNKPKVNMTRSLREVEGLLEASEKQVRVQACMHARPFASHPSPPLPSHRKVV
jgi:hypothetical protein